MMLPTPGRSDVASRMTGGDPTLEGKMACMSIGSYLDCAHNTAQLDKTLDELKVPCSEAEAEARPRALLEDVTAGELQGAFQVCTNASAGHSVPSLLPPASEYTLFGAGQPAGGADQLPGAQGVTWSPASCATSFLRSVQLASWVAEALMIAEHCAPAVCCSWWSCTASSAPSRCAQLKVWVLGC